MALNVKFLKGSQAQFDSYVEANKLDPSTFYYIDNKDLYLGSIKLSNGEDLVAAVRGIVGNYEADKTPATIYALEQAIVALGMPSDKTVQDLIDEAIADIPRGSYYDVTALKEITSPVEGDVAIVSETKEGVIFRTAYHYAAVEDGFAWKAMAGNYNAANVYYDKNIQVTKTVGNVETSNNKPVDLQFKGKNMEQIWQYLYATEDKTLTITQPKATFGVSSNVSKEVGSTFDDPVLSISFADGSYEYGSKDANGKEYKDGVNEAAGVKFNNAVIKLTSVQLVGDEEAETKDEILATKNEASNTKFSHTYNISDNTVAEGTSTWKFSATASCPASTRYPVTNLGNFIKADGTTTTVITEATKNTAAQTATNLGEKIFTVTGWRGCFWGYKESKALDPNNLTSAQIRALSSPTNGFNATILDSKNGTGSALNKMQQIFIAAPKGKYKTVTVTNTDLGAPQTVKKVTDVSVFDATENSNAAAYDVFYVDNDNADSKAYNYKITIA